MIVDVRRIRALNSNTYTEGCVVYWMQRDQRTKANWALLYAQEIAKKNDMPLLVVFNLVTSFKNASTAHFHFMLDGLQVVEKNLQVLGIPFIITEGESQDALLEFLQKEEVGMLVTDFSPLSRKWKEHIAKKCAIPFCEVDTHNIVPCWMASPKEEFAAHTFRPKIKALYREFDGKVPYLSPQKKVKVKTYTKNNWKKLYTLFPLGKTQADYSWVVSGEDAAHKTLLQFIREKLPRYEDQRNDPTKDALSNLSPYLHFGHISAQKVAYEVEKSVATGAVKKTYLEELVVRKELSDNFCFYQKKFDSFEGLKDWAQKTLNEHRKDVREFIYTKKEFEEGRTHDELWNAAQMEMVKKGKMHGYMRMYWAKKILEWTKTPEEAISIAVYLNDTYSLDGRDPNGYVGIMWSIGGIHDRAWFERPVFGKIRYMNYNGCRRKFDVEKYIKYVKNLQ